LGRHVHYAFFVRTRSVGQVEGVGLAEENVHLFAPDDVTSASA